MVAAGDGGQTGRGDVSEMVYTGLSDGAKCWGGVMTQTEKCWAGLGLAGKVADSNAVQHLFGDGLRRLLVVIRTVS